MSDKPKKPRPLGPQQQRIVNAGRVLVTLREGVRAGLQLRRRHGRSRLQRQGADRARPPGARRPAVDARLSSTELRGGAMKGRELISQLHSRQMELATGRLKVIAPFEPASSPTRRDEHTEAMADLLRDAAAALEGKR